MNPALTPSKSPFLLSTNQLLLICSSLWKHSQYRLPIHCFSWHLPWEKLSIHLSALNRTGKWQQNIFLLVCFLLFTSRWSSALLKNTSFRHHVFFPCTWLSSTWFWQWHYEKLQDWSNKDSGNQYSVSQHSISGNHILNLSSCTELFRLMLDWTNHNEMMNRPFLASRCLTQCFNMSKYVSYFEMWRWEALRAQMEKTTNLIVREQSSTTYIGYVKAGTSTCCPTPRLYYSCSGGAGESKKGPLSSLPFGLAVLCSQCACFPPGTIEKVGLQGQNSNPTLIHSI